MTTTLAGIVLIGGFVLLMILRTPVSFAMLAATLGSALITGTNFSVMVRQMVDGANNFSLLSIPFFIVMGEFMSAGGISEKIVDLANPPARACSFRPAITWSSMRWLPAACPSARCLWPACCPASCWAWA